MIGNKEFMTNLQLCNLEIVTSVMVLKMMYWGVDS